MASTCTVRQLVKWITFGWLQIPDEGERCSEWKPWAMTRPRVYFAARDPLALKLLRSPNAGVTSGPSADCRCRRTETVGLRACGPHGPRGDNDGEGEAAPCRTGSFIGG